jgi:hypothetical protein
MTIYLVKLVSLLPATHGVANLLLEIRMQTVVTIDTIPLSRQLQPAESLKTHWSLANLIHEVLS